MRRTTSLAACLATCLAAACHAPQIEPAPQAIIGGVQAEVGAFPSVVAVLNFGLCTGTLVSPSVVLTAAHCIDPALLGLPNQELVAQNTFVVFDNNDINSPEGFSINARQTIKHPGFDVNNLGDNDIGIVILESPVTDRAPSPIDLDPARSLLGASVSLIGFGDRTPGPGDNAGKLFFLAEKTIRDCGPLIGENNALLLCFDQNENGTINGACNGDSGGPALDASGAVLGVTSFGDLDCASFSGYTRVSGEADFVRPLVEGLLDCDTDGACTEGCGPADLDCCAADDVCLASCGIGDPDCENCNDDGTCNPACGQDDQPEDPDCAEALAEPGCAVRPKAPPATGIAFLIAFLGALWRRQGRARADKRLAPGAGTRILPIRR
jgi:hypothetical protein